jgi:hypothetical protein
VAAFTSEWVAAFASEWVAAFTSESLAGFARNPQRYLDRAREMGPVEIPGPKLVFTVKLSDALVGRVRRYAQVRQRTLSSIVAQALEEFLGGGAGPHGG